jgi:hypothetical protein
VRRPEEVTAQNEYELQGSTYPRSGAMQFRSLPSRLRKVTSNVHYVCTALLAVLVIPAIKHLQLPIRLNWADKMEFYWVGIGTKSILRALVFCLLAFPLSETVKPFLTRYRREKSRVLLALVCFGLLSFTTGLSVALLLTADTLFIVELAERAKPEGRKFHKKIISVLVVATYMFVGILLVFIYNDLIVASRFPLSYDQALNRIDSRILLGHNVSEIAHATFRALPRSLLRFTDAAYFQMFLLLGATLLISACHSTRRGLQFAGTCLTAYYLALIIFFIWPTYGPYFYCVDHAARYPSYLATYLFQRGGLPSLKVIAEHQGKYLGSGYYIAFPSLHIALPLIAMWFFRKWRPVFWLLAAYTVLVMFAVVILEWHYLLDIPGGIVVAVVALAMVGPQQFGGNRDLAASLIRRHRRREQPSVSGGTAVCDQTGTL